MAGLGDIFGSIGLGASSGGGMITNMITIFIGMAGLGVCIFGVWWFINKRKNWNLSVEIKIPRNVRQVKEKDGSIRVTGTLNKEWAKGYYNSKQGVVYIKRKGKKPVAMKPFDIKRFLSTGNILTVLQIGIEDYRPIVDDSYIEVIDDETGEEGALVRARIDTSESKSWKNSFERDNKEAFSIKNWISEHGALMAMGLVLLMNLIGFSIVIARMPK